MKELGTAQAQEHGHMINEDHGVCLLHKHTALLVYAVQAPPITQKHAKTKTGSSEKRGG